MGPRSGTYLHDDFRVLLAHKRGIFSPATFSTSLAFYIHHYHEASDPPLLALSILTLQFRLLYFHLVPTPAYFTRIHHCAFTVTAVSG